MRLSALLLLAASFASGAEPFDHSPWDAVVSRHVSAIGEVDYTAIAADRAGLDAYLAALAETSPENRPEIFPDEAAQVAYWINAYNALTINGVLRDQPFPGVRKVRRFFERPIYTVGGRSVSLNNIEHGILRKQFREPRIHFALVCASVSCPNLAPFAFLPATLDEQLEARAKLFISQPRNVAVDGRTLRLSKIFDWFADDFKPVGGVLAFIAQRYEADLPQNPKLRYFDYDWRLNQPGSRESA